MTQSKLKVNPIKNNAVAMLFAMGQMHCSTVPTSAKQLELRVRHEAALSLLERLPEREGARKSALPAESVVV
jgi:hypothetical protein